MAHRHRPRRHHRRPQKPVPSPSRNFGDGQIHSSPASWFGQFRGNHRWHDPNDNGINMGGLPQNVSGIAVPTRATLNHYYVVQDPFGKKLVVRHVDYGPGKSTGRTLDINAATADKLGYSPDIFPTDFGAWKFVHIGAKLPPGWRNGEPPPQHYALGGPVESVGTTQLAAVKPPASARPVPTSAPPVMAAASPPHPAQPAAQGVAARLASWWRDFSFAGFFGGAAAPQDKKVAAASVHAPVSAAVKSALPAPSAGANSDRFAALKKIGAKEHTQQPNSGKSQTGLDQAAGKGMQLNPGQKNGIEAAATAKDVSAHTQLATAERGKAPAAKSKLADSSPNPFPINFLYF